MSGEQIQELAGRLRQQVLDAYDLPPELVQAWEANHATDSAGLTCPDGEPT